MTRRKLPEARLNSGASHAVDAAAGKRIKRMALNVVLIAILTPSGAARAQNAGSVARSSQASSKAGNAAGSTGKSAAGDKQTGAQSESPFGDFSNSNRGPVNVVSDSMNLDYKSNKVLFAGHVHATQADAQLTSNTLNVQYGKDFHEIQNAVADGQVHLSQGLRWCTADHGVLNQAVHTVVLTGNPVCHDGQDQISGPKITVHLDTGKSEVEGGVRAVFFPRQNKTGDNGATAENQTSSASDPVK